MKRNFNLIILLLSAVFLLNFQKKSDTKKNINIDQQKKWIQLFNGKDLNDWVVKISGYPVNNNINNTFRVEDSVIKVSYDEYDKFGESYGHLFYKRSFSNYRLKLQYRFVGEQVADGQEWAKKNSGVMIHSQSPESMLLNQNFPISLEVQLLGGINEGVERNTGNLCTPGTNVIMDSEIITDHCINSTSKTYYGEEWVDLEILVLNDSLISHMINGEEVIKYTKPTFGGDYLTEGDEWQSKNDQSLKEGYIALQSESHPVEFKNIKLLELDF